MAIDIEDGYDEIGKKIKNTKRFKQLQADYKKLKKKHGDSFEKKKEQLTKRYEKYSEKYKAKKKKFNKSKEKFKTQLDELLNLKLESSDDLVKSTIDSLSTNLEKKLYDFEKKHSEDRDVKKYIIRKFIIGIEGLKPEILKLLENEILKAAGCSENQTFTPNQDLYIKLQSIDFLGMLKQDPTSDVGKIIYEQKNLSYPSNPFPMNKEIYNRIQNINQPFSVQYGSQYKGQSTQDLFNMTYVDIDNLGNNGNFLKINLANRVTGNVVKQFLKDYYKTIEVLDFKNIFANLINQLVGALSIEKSDGQNDIIEYQKILLIIQRILGLCFDPNKEIDVSGSAKLSELDNLDDSFFEFSEIDLNFIDETLTNIQNRVAVFATCDNIKLPVNSSAAISAVGNLNFVPGSNNNNNIDDAVDFTTSITENPDWLPIQINLDLEFIKELPKAVINALISPKTLLPFAIVLKSLGNNSLDTIKSYTEFSQKFKNFFVQVVSKIGGIFVKIIFDSVVQDIKKLIKDVIADIKNEKNNKRVKIILALTEIITTLYDLVVDIRECKSVIDELQRLLKLTTKIFGGGGNDIPLPLLAASKFMDGFSSSRAYSGIVGEFESVGIPTGPMADGSPNKFMAAVKAIVDGIDKEEAENGKTEIACLGFTVTPIGMTAPGLCYGKKL
jgi:hypothetical protein